MKSASKASSARLCFAVLILTSIPLWAQDLDQYVIQRAAAPFEDLPTAHLAMNPAHGFETWITEDGIRVRPTTKKSWDLGLALKRVGREEGLRKVETAVLRTDGPRADLDRRDVIEWYHNTEQGLEQGFTIKNKPPGEDADLIVELAFSGNLVTRLTNNGQSIDLLQPGERFPVLSYRKLAVYDADGVKLPARMMLIRAPDAEQTQLFILVSDIGARYPLTIDPLLGSSSWDSGTSLMDSTSIAWGDCDGDGDLDLAIGNSSQGNEIWRNQNGDLGTNWYWKSADTLNTRSVAWGDWDNDGDLDLAVGNDGEKNQVWENNGSCNLGGSEVWNSVPDAKLTRCVAWGDYDNDGYLDLAVGNYNDVNQVWENNGGSSLGAEAAWESNHDAKATRAVAWGDWNGDGDLDLAVGNENQFNQVWANTGVGFGASPVWDSTGDTSITHSVAWGDYDSDGDLDLAVGNYGQVNQIWEMTDNLGTSPVWESTGHTESTRSIAWGDVNGDGRLDLAVGNTDAQVNRVWLNHGGLLGKNAAWTPEVSANIMKTQSVAWGDADNDGDLDLAVGNYGQVNQIWSNSGGDLGTSPVFETTGLERDTRSVAWGDLDGDGALDLAEGNVFQLNYVWGSGGSWTSTGYTDETTVVVWADYEGDGDLDLTEGSWDSSAPHHIFLWGNTGVTLGSSPLADLLCPYQLGIADLAWGDCDSDGDLDLVGGGSSLDDVRLLRNEGGGFYSCSTVVSSKSARSLAWGDWDGDNDLDLAIGHYLWDQVRQYENGAFDASPAWATPGNESTQSVVWGDWDGDGDLDLAVGRDFDRNEVYENTGGDLGTAAMWESSDSLRTSSVAWGDWDSDGDLDLAVGNGDWYDSQVNQVWQNGFLTRPGRLPETPVSPVLADRPGTTPAADFHSTAECLYFPVTLNYTLVDEEYDPAVQIKVEYSPLGGGSWYPATEWTSGSDGTTDLAASPTGTPHVYRWNPTADGVTKADGVRLRITVPWQASTFIGGPIQRAAMSAVSPPFKVCDPADAPNIFVDDFETGNTSRWSDTGG